MSMKTPNYVLNSDHTLISGHDTRVLKEGTFVRPLELHYVPKHVLEANKWVNTYDESFCYTHFGIVPIPKYKLRIV